MEKILIFDISAIMYKSHHSLKDLVNSKSMSTGATFGLVKQVTKYLDKINPDYVVCARDVKKESLVRTKIYSEYKTNRSSMPDELVVQLEYIYNIIENFGLNSIMKQGYEADDIIATVVKMAQKNNLEIHIVTADKDLQQLINDNNKVFIHLLGKNIVVNTRQDVFEYMNVYPEQIPDFFALQGDASDGIPGVYGIGKVIGAKLINQYSTLENIYENIENIKGQTREKLEKGRQLAFISRQLATLYDELDLDISLEDLKMKKKNIPKLKEIFEYLELNSLLALLNEEKKEIQCSYITPLEIYELINKSKKVYIFSDDQNFAFNIDGNIYFVNSQESDTLFSTKFELSDLRGNAKYVMYDAKSYLHKGFSSENEFFDIQLASYVINTEDNLDIENLILKYLGISIPKLEKKSTSEDAINRLKEIIFNLPKLEENIVQKLKLNDNKNTYNTIEKPLINVLYQMEKKGILISKEGFSKLNEKMTKQLEYLSSKIYELAGEKFNIDSPIQLGSILFEKMGISGGKKTKRGYSTDAGVLEKLEQQKVDIASYLLQYRSVKKLLSSYIIPIPQLAGFDNRVRTTFNATTTATGRLSSNNPNLQNIPTRTEEGSLIRTCFVAKKGYKLISFDYSQIELRVLAFLSKDEKLMNAYAQNLDLHTLTAQKLFPNQVIDKEKRNIAKTINFSVLYGKTPFGLKEELNITMQEAKTYINTYFEEYKDVMPYLDSIVEGAKKNKYVETYFGTKRYISNINSQKEFEFAQARRMAINTVVQGTASNIIKMVMIELQKLNYDMLIQVHDELIFEIRQDLIDKAIEEIKNIMENTIVLEGVKLKVNYATADNWGDLK